MGSLQVAGFKHGSDKKILELGCGKGRLASLLRPYGQVTALDYSAATIDDNKKEYPDIEFVVGDVTAPLGYHDAFDAVVSMEMIEHVTYEQQHKVIENAFDALKENGCFIFTTPNRIVNERLNYKGFQPVEDWLSLQEATKLLATKFEVIEAYTVVLTLRPALLDALWKRLFFPVNLYLVQKLIRNSGRGRHLVLTGKKTPIRI